MNDYGGMNTPLIFIHAFPLSGKMWKYQVDFFKNKYRVITYDIRGSGDSKSDDNQFMMENFVDDKSPKLIINFQSLLVDLTLFKGSFNIGEKPK